MEYPTEDVGNTALSTGVLLLSTTSPVWSCSRYLRSVVVSMKQSSVLYMVFQ